MMCVPSPPLVCTLATHAPALACLHTPLFHCMHTPDASHPSTLPSLLLLCVRRSRMGALTAPSFHALISLGDCTPLLHTPHTHTYRTYFPSIHSSCQCHSRHTLPTPAYAAVAPRCFCTATSSSAASLHSCVHPCRRSASATRPLPANIWESSTTCEPPMVEMGWCLEVRAGVFGSWAACP